MATVPPLTYNGIQNMRFFGQESVFCFQAGWEALHQRDVCTHRQGVTFQTILVHLSSHSRTCFARSLECPDFEACRSTPFLTEISQRRRLKYCQKHSQTRRLKLCQKPSNMVKLALYIIETAMLHISVFTDHNFCDSIGLDIIIRR